MQVLKDSYRALYLTDIKVRIKAKIRNRYNQAQHLTKDTTWESNKDKIKHHPQESQKVIPFPSGDHKATMNRQENTTNKETQITKMIHKSIPPKKKKQKKKKKKKHSHTPLLEGLN